MQLLRIVPLIIYLLKAKLAGTEKAKYRLWAKQYFTFGAQVANHTIIALLGLSYCCLAPLVAPFCLLYFALAVMSQKYQLVYVSTIQYDATGRMWLNVSCGFGWCSCCCSQMRRVGFGNVEDSRALKDTVLCSVTGASGMGILWGIFNAISEVVCACALPNWSPGSRRHSYASSWFILRVQHV